jgi:dTDP-4-dehydrorhamnose 3,5-epimerase
MSQSGNLRCPQCLGKLFRMSNVQSLEMQTIWVCEGCGFDNAADRLTDKTPEGCLTVTIGREIMKNIDGVEVKVLKSNEDDRGWLAEIFRKDQIPELLNPAMGYVSCTRPGIVRGPHEHYVQWDYFVFLTGTWNVKLWDSRPESNTKGLINLFKVDVPTIVIVPAGVVHAYANIGQRNGLVLNLPNELYRGEGKTEAVDEVRHEDNPEYPVQDMFRTVD